MAVVPDPIDTPPQRRLWTADEYLRAAEVGIFGEDERLELLEGEIVRQMTPQGLRHVVAVTKAHRWLAYAAGPNRDVISQATTRMSLNSMPEPDVAVLSDLIENLGRYPEGGDVLLAVEVSDSSLGIDRHQKSRIYAAAGVPEYWIVNLQARALEVHREPDANGYRLIRRYSQRESIQPLFSEREVLVSDLLPKE